MRIEQRSIDLGSLNLEQVRIDGCIRRMKGGKPFRVSPDQLEYLELMRSGASLRKIAQTYFQKGICPSFDGLYGLIHFLVNEDIITDRRFQSHFKVREDEAAPAGMFENIISSVFGPAEAPIKVRQEVRGLPFFRSLQPELLEFMFANARVIETPRNVVVCQAGQHQRNLFVLLRGRAAIYRRERNGQRTKLATLQAGSVFGETGFFLDKPRTADVITEENSVIMKIRHTEEFDEMIKTEKARELQQRFWVIHALLNSEMFRNIPADCFDALVFSGKFRKFPAHVFICKEGQPGKSAYLVIQGSVVVTQKTRPIRALGQGDCFGEISLMLNNGIRTASVHSDSEVLAMEISMAKFQQLLAENLLLARELERVALNRYGEDFTRKPA